KPGEGKKDREQEYDRKGLELALELAGKESPRHGNPQQEAAKYRMDANAVGEPDREHEEHEGDCQQGWGELAGAFGGSAEPGQEFAAKREDQDGKDHSAADSLDGYHWSGPKAGQHNRQDAPGPRIADGTGRQGK